MVWAVMTYPMPLWELEQTAFEKTVRAGFKNLYQKWFGVVMSFTTISPYLFKERFCVLCYLTFPPLLHFIVTFDSAQLKCTEKLIVKCFLRMTSTRLFYSVFEKVFGSGEGQCWLVLSYQEFNWGCREVSTRHFSNHTFAIKVFLHLWLFTPSLVCLCHM